MILKSKEKLFSIGEVSDICNIPIKTLRYYNSIGLLIPEVVDKRNNYRYYSKDQILYINIIKDLKKFGFSLQDIKTLLRREDLSLFKTKLELKLNETAKNIVQLQYLQEKLKLYLETLNQGKTILESFKSVKNSPKNQKVEVKNIPVYSVAYTRYRCPCNPSAFVERYSQLHNFLEKYNLHKAGPLMAVFHDHYTQFNYDNADIEVCVPVIEDSIDCPVIRKFGGFLAAVILHMGKCTSMVESYKEAVEWIEENGYQLNGPAVEKYILDAGSTSFEENYVTEIILPIKKY